MYELSASFGLNRQVVSINIGSGVDCLTSGDSRHFANRGSENDQAGNNIAVTEGRMHPQRERSELASLRCNDDVGSHALPCLFEHSIKREPRESGFGLQTPAGLLPQV